MQAPQTKQELQSFLGMVNYLAQFIKDMSQLTHNMRLLLKKNALFQWTESHEANFQRLKESISSDTCLMYFDTSKPITLQVDASQVGLGGVLLQEDSQGRTRPVAYASKALTPCETRYANIEREMLAVAWGCIKFHHYLYGRKFICQTDHKPLEDIHLKHLSDAPPRLQRLLLKLQPYDITIKYVPGQKVPVADALSRVSPSGKTEIKGLDVTIHDLTTTLNHVQVEAIQQATREDQVLQMLMQQMMQGWPDHIKLLPVALKPFWQLKEDLSIEHSCVTFQGRFYIPSVLRAGCLKALHQGHPGIVKMKLRAQTSMYWLGLNKEIENHVMHCEPCQVLSKSQQKEPAIPMEIPSRPWQKLGVDLFLHNSSWYVIVADYYSKYPWIFQLAAISSKDVISALKFCFSEYGIPEEVISDNGPQFTAREYQDFAAQYGFRLTTSSPYYPKGHGFIERQVQTIKNLLSKCAKDGSDLYLALLQLRSTPLDSRTPSPGELLQNRKLRTTLPVIIRPPPNSEAVRAALQSRQVYTNHDAHAKELSKLLPTQPVWVQNTLTKKWEKGVIKSQAETPRSYIVLTPQGEKRRNRIHLREAGISTNAVPKAPNEEKVKYVLLAPNKSPSVQSVCQPNEGKVSQSVVENVPKANVQNVLRPKVKLVPKVNVQSSGLNSTVNSAGKESAYNQSASSVSKLVVRKDQRLVQEDSKGVPTAPIGIGNNNKAIPKVSAPKPPDPKPSVQEDNNLRRSTRERKPNKKYLDISSILTGFNFWNQKSSYQSDIHIV